MATPHILPLGFIYRTTPDGAVIMLTSPQDSLTLRTGAPVTLWQYSRGLLAAAKVRGQISAVGYATASFTTIETRTDPRWPEGRELLLPRTPVYLALPNSFEPDLSRMLTLEQADDMERLARRHAELTRPRRPKPPNGKPWSLDEYLPL